MTPLQTLLAELVAAFPNVNVAPATFAVYERELADVPLEPLARKVRLTIRESRFFPSVAELREALLPAALANGPLTELQRVMGLLPSPYASHEEVDAAMEAIGIEAMSMIHAIGGFQRMREMDTRRLESVWTQMWHMRRDRVLSGAGSLGLQLPAAPDDDAQTPALPA